VTLIMGIDPGACTGLAYVIDGHVESLQLRTINQLHDIPEVILGEDNYWHYRDGWAVSVFIERACIRGSASGTSRSALHVAEISACFLGVCLGWGATAELIPVMKWKRNTPKAIMHKRLLKRMDVTKHIPPKELAKIGSGKPSKWENALDACGLALWGYKQLTEREDKE